MGKKELCYMRVLESSPIPNVDLWDSGNEECKDLSDQVICGLQAPGAVYATGQPEAARSCILTGFTNESWTRCRHPLQGRSLNRTTFFHGAAAVIFTTAVTPSSVGFADGMSLPSCTDQQNESHPAVRSQETDTITDMISTRSSISTMSELKPTELQTEDVEFKAEALGIGIITTNCVVHGAFMFGRYLSGLEQASPRLIGFMDKNFLLSHASLRMGYWSSLFAHVFAHLNLRHLAENCVTAWVGIEFCTPFIGWKEMALLYVVGGVLGGTATMMIGSIMRKACYQGYCTGGSGGVYALCNFFLCAKDRGPRFCEWLPLDMVDTFFIAILLKEMLGLLMYFRYGAVRKGFWRGSSNHIAHLVGAATGFAAYGLLRVLNDNNNYET